MTTRSASLLLDPLGGALACRRTREHVVLSRLAARPSPQWSRWPGTGPPGRRHAASLAHVPPSLSLTRLGSRMAFWSDLSRPGRRPDWFGFGGAVRVSPGRPGTRPYSCHARRSASFYDWNLLIRKFVGTRQPLLWAAAALAPPPWWAVGGPQERSRRRGPDRCTAPTGPDAPPLVSSWGFQQSRGRKSQRRRHAEGWLTKRCGLRRGLLPREGRRCNGNGVPGVISVTSPPRRSSSSSSSRRPSMLSMSLAGGGMLAAVRAAMPSPSRQHNQHNIARPEEEEGGEGRGRLFQVRPGRLGLRDPRRSRGRSVRPAAPQCPPHRAAPRRCPHV